MKEFNISIKNHNGVTVHVATIRSDWKEADFQALSDFFPHCYVESKSMKCPLCFLGSEDHFTSFKYLKKFH